MCGSSVDVDRVDQLGRGVERARVLAAARTAPRTSSRGRRAPWPRAPRASSGSRASGVVVVVARARAAVAVCPCGLVLASPSSCGSSRVLHPATRSSTSSSRRLRQRSRSSSSVVASSSFSGSSLDVTPRSSRSSAPRAAPRPSCRPPRRARRTSSRRRARARASRSAARRRSGRRTARARRDRPASRNIFPPSSRSRYVRTPSREIVVVDLVAEQVFLLEQLSVTVTASAFSRGSTLAFACGGAAGESPGPAAGIAIGAPGDAGDAGSGAEAGAFPEHEAPALSARASKSREMRGTSINLAWSTPHCTRAQPLRGSRLRRGRRWRRREFLLRGERRCAASR